MEKILAKKNPILCEVMMNPEQIIAPKQALVTLEDGKIISRSFEDIAPFLKKETFQNKLVIRTI